MVRVYMQHGVLLRLLQFLGLDNLEPSFDTSPDWIQRELKGRVFWACWLIDSFSATKTSETHVLVGDSINTPLPCSETEFASKKRNSRPLRLKDVGTTESVLAELMKAARLWYSKSRPSLIAG